MTQAPRRPRAGRLIRILLYAISLAWIAIIWAGIRMIQAGLLAVGLGMAAVGLVTLVLWLRFVRREPDPATDGSYDITEAQIDNAVWVALGMPLVFIGLLLLVLLTNGT
jgi:hypothetical protein